MQGAKQLHELPHRMIPRRDSSSNINLCRLSSPSSGSNCTDSTGKSTSGTTAWRVLHFALAPRRRRRGADTVTAGCRAAGDGTSLRRHGEEGLFGERPESHRPLPLSRTQAIARNGGPVAIVRDDRRLISTTAKARASGRRAARASPRSVSCAAAPPRQPPDPRRLPADTPRTPSRARPPPRRASGAPAP